MLTFLVLTCIYVQIVDVDLSLFAITFYRMPIQIFFGWGRGGWQQMTSLP